jgi:hypothetical protein
MAGFATEPFAAPWMDMAEKRAAESLMAVTENE